MPLGIKVNIVTKVCMFHSMVFTFTGCNYFRSIIESFLIICLKILMNANKKQPGVKTTRHVLTQGETFTVCALRSSAGKIAQ